MKYNVTLSQEELETIIQALDMLFDDCTQHRDSLVGLEDREIGMFRDAMAVGKLLERFVDVFESGEH